MSVVRLMVSGSRVDGHTLAAIKNNQALAPIDWRADEALLTCWTHPRERAKYWVAQLEDTAQDFYWLVRGGEGTADMIPYLHNYYDQLAKLPPRTIIGMSDATALLVYCAQNFGWPCIHLSNAIGLTVQDRIDSPSLQAVTALLTQKTTPNTLQDLIPLNSCAAKHASLEGLICVGNLTMLNISIGDVWEFDATDKILMIEDWHEKGYAIWRTLKYLQRIGKLNAVKAVVFGDFFYEMKSEPQRAYVQKILQRFALSLSVPVFQTDQFGHGQKQTPLVFNQPFAATCRIGYSIA
jgi:muramoyltetrapeptide carboxypeptidase